MKLGVAILCLVLGFNAAADPRVDQARREGELAWYTSMNVSDVDAVLKPFRERHPFLEVNILRAAPPRVLASVLAEARDGRFSCDLVSITTGEIDALLRERLLASYVSPESSSGFPPGMVDPAGHWAAIYVLHFVLGYNTRLVAPADAPRTWNDLLSPRWKGRVALDATDAQWYAGMLDYWGRDKGLAFMQALAAQKPQLRTGHEAMAGQLAAGEFAVALGHLNQFEKQRQAGAAVQWVKTLDPVIASPSHVAICAKAPHPAAARLLVDYLLSREGQRAIAARGRVPVRTDIGTAQPPRPPKVHYVGPHLVAKLPAYQAEFRRVLASGR